MCSAALSCVLWPCHVSCDIVSIMYMYNNTMQAVDRMGRTALYIAAQEGQQKPVNMLTEMYVRCACTIIIIYNYSAI